MRTILLFATAFCCSFFSFSQTHMITFQVDMNEVQEAFTTPEVNGSFNGWCGACAPMSDANMDGIWELTAEIPDGAHEFKFAFDNWAGQENLIPGSSCTLTTGAFTNRTLTVDSDETLPVVCWGSCQACGIEPSVYNVTFQIDMNEYATPFTTPEVNGTFNAWCGSCAAMTDANLDGVWEITIPLVEGSYQYKFSHDNWGGQENLTPGTSCTVSADGFTNRTVVVSQNTTLEAVCWNSCEVCNPIVDPNQMDLPVTFELEGINYGVIGFGGAEVSTIETDPTDDQNTCVKVIKSATAATWAGTSITDLDENGLATPIPFDAQNTTMSLRVWSPDAGIVVRLKVEDHNDPTHSVETDAMTTAAGQWETLVFDFANEGAGTAALNLNYVFDYPSVFFNYNVPGEVAGEKTYYFDDLMFGGSQQVMSYDVTFQVDMNNVTENFTTPEVPGQFNDWCGGCAPMTDANSDGIWELTVTLEEGSYEYKFAYDNWTNSEQLTAGTPCTVTADGFTNRILNVTGDVVLPPVCWASCDACGIQPIMHDVTFQVDMNQVTDNFTTPEVNGTFNGWCGACAPMSDANSDGIWELTISIAEGVHEFKYAYDNWASSEQLAEGSSCTITTDGFTNRLLNVTGDIVLDPVCWASCQACGNQTGPYNITFQVDMSTVTDNFTTPEVNGVFNGWCGGCAPMTDANSDGIWELVISLEEGTYEYKYAFDTWAGQENLVPGSECTLTTGQFTNRLVEVTGDAVLPVVCWGSCSTCDDPQGPFNVVFSVDMSQVTDVYTTPEVNGTFNNWCGGCAPMTDANNDDIWELTIPLAADTFEYKFAFDSWAGQEELTPGSTCTVTVDNFTNRQIIVTDNIALPVVCWASCNACIVGVEEMEQTNSLTLYPNPVQDQLQIAMSRNLGENVQVRITDLGGKVIQSEKVYLLQNHTLNITDLADGMYLLHVNSASSNYVQSFVVRK
jgi:1,4-alpha-glucan branching enzyme